MQQADPKRVAEFLDQQTCDFYLRSLAILDKAKIPYMVGGAYALAYHAGIVRHTKDLDLFIREEHAQKALGVYAAEGYRAEMTFPHWLGKAFHPSDPTTFVDLIFGSGNGIARVDEAWFENAVDGEVFGRRARLCPAEEIIWSKSFVMERERFDGADVAHLMVAQAERLDWQRLVWRFTGHERVLLSHVMLFSYAYPAERHRVPAWVVDELMSRIKRENGHDDRVCRGTNLSREQYLIDVTERGFRDARVAPQGPMSKEHVRHWTEAIGKIK